MNNLIREHFDADGFPKRKRLMYDAIETAEHFDLNAYECSFCGYWHLGRKREE